MIMKLKYECQCCGMRIPLSHVKESSKWEHGRRVEKVDVKRKALLNSWSWYGAEAGLGFGCAIVREKDSLLTIISKVAISSVVGAITTRLVTSKYASKLVIHGSDVDVVKAVCTSCSSQGWYLELYSGRAFLKLSR